MIKLLLIILGIVLLSFGFMGGIMVSHQPIQSCTVNEIVIEQNCSINECQTIIMDAYYSSNYAKHCLNHPEAYECMS